MDYRIRRTPVLFATLACLLICRFAGAVTIATVPIANPGNMADSTGFGAVAYNYRHG